MPVQLRSRPVFSSRGCGVKTILSSLTVLLLASAIPLLALGCAHSAAKTEPPAASADSPELASLRRENAALRSRVQNLEERLRMLERGESVALGPSSGDGYQRYGSLPTDPRGEWDEWDEPESDGPRQLPVVKLTPSGKSIEQKLLIEADHFDQPLNRRPAAAKRQLPVGLARDGNHITV